MKGRCLNPNNPRSKYYGQRGITVCERWMRFTDFATDVGEPPSSEYQLDRIDNEGHYAPGNVRWVTPAQNNMNTRANVFLSHDGRRMTITEWERVRGWKKGTLKRRIQRGWSVREALDTSIEPDPTYTFNGETHNLSQWARILNVEHSMLMGRIIHGWPLERVFGQARRNRRRKHKHQR